MLSTAANVVPFQPRGASRENATADDLPVPLRCLAEAVQELDDLRCWAGRIVRNPQWSAIEWRATCSPLLLHLPKVQRSLAELGRIRIGRWPDVGWAARFRAAHSEVERRLMDVSISMSALASEETSSSDAVVTFSSDAALLADATDELCGLVASRYPAAITRLGLIAAFHGRP